MTHETLDQIKLTQHKLIAKKLRENPEAVLGLTRRNLRRYIGGGRRQRPLFGGSGLPCLSTTRSTALSRS
jgi:hypothetical protein